MPLFIKTVIPSLYICIFLLFSCTGSPQKPQAPEAPEKEQPAAAEVPDHTEAAESASGFPSSIHSFGQPQQAGEVIKELEKRWKAPENKIYTRNIQGFSIMGEGIHIDLIVNTPEKQREFREKIMDSPLFSFYGPEKPVKCLLTGVSDTLGASLLTEYPVYSTQTEQVKFLLYNRSGREIVCGAGYTVAREGANGEWFILPQNDIVLSIAYSVLHNGEMTLSAALNPDLHPNPPGRYRIFYTADIGYKENLTLVADFRLSNQPEEWQQAVRTVAPPPVSQESTEEKYWLQEDEILDTKVFTSVEQMPVFTDGGIEGALRFITDHLPENISEEGRVIVRVIVEKDGSLTIREVIRSMGQRLDKEACRIIQAMPRWTPGRHRGKPVRVEYVVPVEFKRKG